MTSSTDLAMLEPLRIDGAVAVVTGGASGIGRALTRALIGGGARVVIADIESEALATTVEELDPGHAGAVVGHRTDVTDEESVSALADAVWDRFGRCDLLFLNAGVTSGGGGWIWDQEPNDWRWCFGVNVFGTAIGVSTFVPRMLADGHRGHVVVTSSKDGGVAPVPHASVYAASKAALSCLTESLQHQLVETGSAVRASVFYPSGGLLDTGLYSAARNRPTHLARVAPGRGSMSFTQLVERVTEATGAPPPIADLDDLAAFVLAGVERGDFVIARDLDVSAEVLHERADAIGRAELPPRNRLKM